MEFSEINILASVVDDTFQNNYDGIGSFRCVGKMHGDKALKITCMVVVNLLNRSEMQREADKARDQLNKACNEYMKKIKADFKTAAGRALKTKKGGVDESVELINMSAYSPKGTALVRSVYTFEVS
jgi:hypothetical protein